MYLLYLDDSGSAENKNESHFVLGGFFLHERNMYWTNKRLEEIAGKYGESVELHASEISGGRKRPWSDIKIKQERCEILKDVLRIAADVRNNIRVLACAIDKSCLAPDEDPVSRAFEDLCGRFQSFLQKQYSKDNSDDTGMIILDKSTCETTLQRCALDFRTLGNRWGIMTDKIQEVPLFADSKASRYIQLADHIAYAVFRRYEHQDLSYYNIIEGVLDSDNTRIHGLCHITHNAKCTCPSCIQRRVLNNIK